MRLFAIGLISFLGIVSSYGQGMFGLEEMNSKSNDFTKFVMNESSLWQEKLAKDIVPIDIDDFGLSDSDSLSMIRIQNKFVEYYDYLLNYQKKNGITTNNLASIFIESAKSSSDEVTCFNEWYKRESLTIAVTLACYNSDIESVKTSCIARSIQATIVNNASVAECFKASDKEK